MRCRMIVMCEVKRVTIAVPGGFVIQDWKKESKRVR